MPAILGAPIARALHLPTSVFFGLFSGALLLSAVVGPSVGRLIDRHGGRHLLAASNLVIAVGLLILATAHSRNCLDDPRYRHRHGSVRSSLCYLDLALWPRRTQLDHRDHFDCRLCQHDRVAVDRGVPGPIWLACRLSGLGWLEHAARCPGQLAGDSAPWCASGATAGHHRNSGGPAAARGDANPGVLFRRYLVRARSDGGAFTGIAAGGGCVLERGDRRRVAGGPGPSRRPHRRVSIIALVPPDLLGAARFGAASDWRRLPCRA